MNQLQYKNYKTSILKCPCCNKYINDDVFVLRDTKWDKLVDVLLVKADTIEQLEQEFQLTIEDYLEDEVCS